MTLRYWGKTSFLTGIIRTTGPNLHIVPQRSLGRLLGQPGRAKAGQCFYCFFYPLPQIASAGKRGLLGSEKDNVGRNTNLLNKSTKCFKEIDPKGIEKGPGFCLTQVVGTLEG